MISYCTKMYWKNTFQSQTYHFCLKSLKRLFCTHNCDIYTYTMYLLVYNLSIQIGQLTWGDKVANKSIISATSLCQSSRLRSKQQAEPVRSQHEAVTVCHSLRLRSQPQAEVTAVGWGHSSRLKSQHQATVTASGWGQQLAEVTASGWGHSIRLRSQHQAEVTAAGWGHSNTLRSPHQVTASGWGHSSWMRSQHQADVTAAGWGHSSRLSQQQASQWQAEVTASSWGHSSRSNKITACKSDWLLILFLVYICWF